MTEQEIFIMNSDSTHVDLELSFDNGIKTIKNNGIYFESMSLIDSISDSESIVFGKCNISQFQVKVADFEGNIDGALMNVLLKFSNEELGECEYNLGRYIVSDSERTSDKMFRIITAYDKMSLFNIDIANWYNYTLFPFEVVDNNLGWLPVNENGVVIDLTYSVSGEPQTSLDKNDDGAYYLNTNDGIVYVGYATYDESGEFASVEWRTYLQCEKNESYTESCNITRTVNEILSMLCEYVGVTYNTDFVLVNGGITVGRGFNPQSLNGLDFLQQICELNGVFGHINNNGVLDFIAPDKRKKQTVDTFKKCDYSEYTVQPINSVSIKHDSNDMGTAVTRPGIDKLNQYEIVGNIFLQSIKREDELNTIAEKILSVIENVTYVPCSVEVKCGLNFELGDFITVNAKTIKEESVSSVSFDALVLCRNISGIQSIFNRIEAKGTEYVNKNAESLSSQLQITNKTIDKLYKEYTANVANFMHLYSKAITTDSLSANVANIGTLNANSAFVKFITGDVINANYIRSLTADIGYLTADSAIISNLQTTKLNTSDLNAEVAKLGYLSAEQAEISYAKIDFSNVGTQVVSSSMIIDGAVTNEKVGNLSANKITSGTIDASKITVTNLNADNLTVGTINGKMIGNGSVDLNKLSQEVPTKEYLDNVEKNLQNQIDGAIETFTKTEIPTLNNEPASLWTDNDTKKKHIGDICYVVNPASSADGYCYRFANLCSESDPSYQWVLIKDSDVTKALQDIIDINGEITGIKKFDNEISSWKTDTDNELSSIKARTSTLETEMGTKVELSVFNEVKQTVDKNSSSITSLSTTVSKKADSSTVTALNNTVNSVKQTVDTNTSSISSMQTEITKKADGSTVTALTNRVSNVEQNLDGFKTTVSQTYTTKEEFTSVETIATQTADKFNWLVKSGTSATDFTLTDRTAALVSDYINLKGLVTFSGLNSEAQSKINTANSTANTANTKAQGIIDNIYTPNTTTIDGGKITTNSIKAAQIDTTDLFAQNITATGTITGATLKGAYVEANSGTIGNWIIDTGEIRNVYKYVGSSESDTTNYIRTTRLGSDGIIKIEKDFYNLSTSSNSYIDSIEINGSNLELKQGNEWCRIAPQGIYIGYDSTTVCSIDEEGINGTIAWANISGRPTALSSFTNDTKYITNTTSVLYIGSTTNNGYIDYYYNKNRTRLTANTALSSAITVRLPASGGTLALASSDIRLKDNVNDSVVNAIDLIKKIKVRQFDWNNNNQNGYLMNTHQKIGFIADELESLDKRLAIGGGFDDEGEMNVKTVDTFYMLGYVVKALQEIIKKLDM